MSPKMIERFSKPQIGAHAVLALSIMTLYLTGIPLLFPNELGWIPELIGLTKSMFIHRIAAIGLIGSTIYYLVYFVLQMASGNSKPLKNVLIDVHDVKDVVADMKYAFGIKKEKPTYRKFNWIEKIDIFSVAIFDTAIMGLTGIVIWIPWLSMSIFSKSTVLVFKEIHGGFAILSLCGILLHFYEVHLTPSRFPLDKVIFTGKMDEHEVLHDYKLWHDEITEGDE